MGLGAAQQPMPRPLAAMSKMALPYIAHLYTNTMQFKRTIGSVAPSTVMGLVSKPGLKMTLNGGYHPVTLDLSAAQPPANLVADPGFEASDVLADVAVNYLMGGNGTWALMTTPSDLHSGRRALKYTTTNLTLRDTLQNYGPVDYFPPGWSAAARTKVVPGQTYRVSMWSKQTAGSVQTYSGAYFLDATGTFISEFYAIAPYLSGSSPWKYYTSTAVAPANAVAMAPFFNPGWWDGVTGANAQFWVDDLRLAVGMSTDDPIQNGDIIQLTEQGDPGSAILYTGIVEAVDDETSPDVVRHQISLAPMVVELGDSYFNQQYTVLTDVAQMVRDAVAATNHLTVQPWSVGDTGVKAIYNFNSTNALEVLNVAKKIAGVNFWWFVDASGLVWFQSATPANPPKLTLKRGSDLNGVHRTVNISGLKNFGRALGGYPTGALVPITSQYNNAVSRKKYGTRTMDPPLLFPTVSDQATLDKIMATAGAAFDRELVTVVLKAPALGTRLTLGIPGGLTARYWEPATDEYPQPSSSSGAVSPNYIAQDIEINGAEQILMVGDVAVAGLADEMFELNRIVQRVGMLGGTY